MTPFAMSRYESLLAYTANTLMSLITNYLLVWLKAKNYGFVPALFFPMRLAISSERLHCTWRLSVRMAGYHYSTVCCVEQGQSVRILLREEIDTEK